VDWISLGCYIHDVTLVWVKWHEPVLFPFYSSFEIFLELEAIALWFYLSIDHTNKSLCFIRRNLKVQSQTIKERAYQTAIRHKLEYCYTVWDPHTNENINSLEKVQRRAARYTCNRHHNTSTFRFLLIKHNDLFALVAVCWMWVFHFRSVEIVTPRYFACWTDSNIWPCII
jgi:hypothetical protein